MTPLPLTAALAERWRAAQPLRWWRALPAAAAWVVVAVVATLLSDDTCSVASPCGPAWADMVEFVSALAAPVLLLWWAPLGIGVSLFGAADFLVMELALGELPAWLAVGGPLLAAGASLDLWAARRRRGAASAALAADLPHALVPGDRPPLRRATWPVVAAAALVLLSVGLLALGLVRGHHEAARERVAERVVATVVGHGDDGYLITVELEDGLDARRVEIDTLEAGDFPVGSDQPVLVLEDGRVRLVAEPYDPTGWGAGALVALLVATVLAGREAESQRRLRRLLTEPQPVHLVRLASSWEGAQVLTVDGDADPLLQLDLVPVDDQDGPEVWDDELEEEPEERELVLATLYGVPVRGALQAVVLEDGLRLLPTRRAKGGDPAWREQWVDIDTSADLPEAPVATEADPTEQVAAADLARWRAELLRPERWRAPLGLLLISGALIAAYVVGRESEGVLATLWRCALAASFAFDGLVHLATRVQLTPDGLVHDGPTTRRTVPWSALRGLTVADGDVVLARTPDEVLPLTWLPHRPRLGGKPRRREWARHWAAVLAAEARQAGSGPDLAVRTEPRLHAAVLALAFTAAVLLGLWSRGAL